MGESVKPILLRSVEKHYKRIAPVIESVESQDGSILPSEMLAFIALCLEKGIELVVESGRRNGYSTEVLAHFPEWDLVSLECSPSIEADKRIRERFPEARLEHADAERSLSSWCSRKTRTAVLLDGPKGFPAYSLMQRLRERVVFWALHDVYRGRGGETHEIRLKIKADEDRYFLTDDEEYLKRYGFLDWNTLRSSGYRSHSELLPFAGVLCLLPGGRFEEARS